MAEETKVKSERPESSPNVNPYTRRPGRVDNRNRNQRFMNTTEKFVRKITDKLVRRTKAIRGHIFESTLFGKVKQYWKIIKEIYEYDGTNFNSNVMKSIKTLNIPVLTMLDTPMPHTNDGGV